MARIYAETCSGLQLAFIECDGCDALIRPHKDIGESGWMRSGTLSATEKIGRTYHWCPECWDKRENGDILI